MIGAGIAFLLGVAGLQPLSVLPDIAWSCLLVPVAWLAFRFPVLRFMGVMACGFLWALLHAGITLERKFPAGFEGRVLQVEGHIASLPQRMDRYTRFEFDIRVLHSSEPMQVLPLPMRVRLNWYDKGVTPVAGDYWRFSVKLNRPHGFMNPGGLDYEAWLYDQGIRAAGYIRKSDQNTLLHSDPWRYPLTRLRQAIVQPLHEKMRVLPHAGILLALAVGERADISAQQWALLNQTGTSHLISISGMNVGMMAAIGFAAALMFWRLLVRFLPWFGLRYPARSFALICAFCVALLYSALVGFSLPTVRAVIMLGVVLAGMLLSRAMRPFSSLMLALLAVLLVDPFAVNVPGFWLSYLAVAVLVLVLSYRPVPQTGIRQWFSLQLAITLALLPVTLIWFQRAAVLGALANVMAIPLIGFVIGPLALLGVVLFFVFEPLAQLLFSLADLLLDWVFFPSLAVLARLPLSSWERAAPPLWAWLPTALGIMLLIAPRGLPARSLGLLLLVPLFCLQPAKPGKGEVWFSLLDVGQGLSAVIQTQQHTLVYDTGPQLSEDFDTGRAVIVPFLWHQGIQRLDVLMISHSDNDHAGGAQSLVKVFPPVRVLASDPGFLQARSIQALPCTQGMHWRWDGVTFEVLHPASDSGLADRNNRSCVLKVTADGGALLLPGDIEREAEQRLLQSGQDLKADILVAAHHGSRTSSTEAFIAAVAPRHVLFAVGYRNRYGFPKQVIEQRYRMQGAAMWATSKAGSIMFKFDQRNTLSPVFYRAEARRYWHWQEEPLTVGKKYTKSSMIPDQE